MHMIRLERQNDLLLPFVQFQNEQYFPQQLQELKLLTAGSPSFHHVSLCRVYSLFFIALCAYNAIP